MVEITLVQRAPKELSSKVLTEDINAESLLNGKEGALVRIMVGKEVVEGALLVDGANVGSLDGNEDGAKGQMLHPALQLLSQLVPPWEELQVGQLLSQLELHVQPASQLELQPELQFESQLQQQETSFMGGGINVQPESHDSLQPLLQFESQLVLQSQEESQLLPPWELEQVQPSSQLDVQMSQLSPPSALLQVTNSDLDVAMSRSGFFVFGLGFVILGSGKSRR